MLDVELLVVEPELHDHGFAGQGPDRCRPASNATVIVGPTARKL
jgi:hypothetical protein